MTANEVKEVLRRMSVSERCEVLAWLVELDDDAWDKQIEADFAAGRLDAMLADAEREYQAGLAKPF